MSEAVIEAAETTTTSKDHLKSYVEQAAYYLPPQRPPQPPQPPSSQMPNQSKISFKPQDEGSGGLKPNFIEEQSLGEAEVSTNYNDSLDGLDGGSDGDGEDPIRDQFQLPGSLNLA